MKTARTRIKICGLRHEADVVAAVEAGADAVGFVLYERSVRHVDLAHAAALSRGLPAFVTPVLLFVDAAPQAIAEAVAAVPHALLQFHGSETPEDCARWQRPYLRAIAMHEGVALLDFAARFHNAAAILVDAPVQGHGGGGKVFDWSLLRGVVVPTPVVLSGGLNAANVIDGVLQVRPFAVDVSSGVERIRGQKDPDLIRSFCEAVREADARIADAAH
jgi:phosphoribosylanthranilate isomerase